MHFLLLYGAKDQWIVQIDILWEAKYSITSNKDVARLIVLPNHNIENFRNICGKYYYLEVIWKLFVALNRFEHKTRVTLFLFFWSVANYWPLGEMLGNSPPEHENVGAELEFLVGYLLLQRIHQALYRPLFPPSYFILNSYILRKDRSKVFKYLAFLQIISVSLYMNNDK